MNGAANRKHVRKLEFKHSILKKKKYLKVGSQIPVHAVNIFELKAQTWNGAFIDDFLNLKKGT